MTQPALVRKASGEKELFSQKKLEDSLKRVGADNQTIGKISDDLSNWLYDGISTKKIYRQAFGLLRHYKNSTAARYKLKQAIMELGPTGFPFEHFVGQIIMHFGFEISVGQIVQGQCIQHEVDVVATGNNKQIFVECKFYNSQGKHANVQVPLYIRSRVDDIIKKRQMFPEFNNHSFQGWIVTNTRFTSDAIQYGKCAGLHLISWDYPPGHGLKDIIERENFFPVTALTTINTLQKKILLDEGIVLCRQLRDNPGVLNKLEIKPRKRRELEEEIYDLTRSNETPVKHTGAG